MTQQIFEADDVVYATRDLTADTLGYYQNNAWFRERNPDEIIVEKGDPGVIVLISKSLFVRFNSDYLSIEVDLDWIMKPKPPRKGK